MKQQPRCLMIEHEANSHIVYRRAWGKQPCCLMTEQKAKQPRGLQTGHDANGQAVYWHHRRQKATLLTIIITGRIVTAFAYMDGQEGTWNYVNWATRPFRSTQQQLWVGIFQVNWYVWCYLSSGCYLSSWMLSFKRVLSFKRDAIFQAGCYLSSGCFKLDAIFQATDTRDIRLSFKLLIHGI